MNSPLETDMSVSLKNIECIFFCFSVVRLRHELNSLYLCKSSEMVSQSKICDAESLFIMRLAEKSIREIEITEFDAIGDRMN